MPIKWLYYTHCVGQFGDTGTNIIFVPVYCVSKQLYQYMARQNPVQSDAPAVVRAEFQKCLSQMPREYFNRGSSDHRQHFF